MFVLGSGRRFVFWEGGAVFNQDVVKKVVLVNKASNDYGASKILLNDRARDNFIEIICFHCQQCVEKSLKAFLLSHEVCFPKTNDVLLLQTLCVNVDEKFNEFDLSDFSRYGLEILYEDVLLSMEDAEKALETAGKVLDYVKSLLNDGKTRGVA
jgi:HEPN domain-containing protein